MLKSDAFDYAIRILRGTKESTVAAMEGDDPGDICPAAFFERNGKIVAAYSAPVVHRDIGLQLADIGVRGFAADALVWAADSHISRSPINPTTGKRWGPGEMQNACDTDGACTVGLLQDVILVVRVDRVLGHTNFLSMAYEVNKENKTVKWLDEVDDREGTGIATGYIANRLQAAIEQTPLRTRLIASNKLPIGLPEMQQSGIDMATSIALDAAGMSGMLLDGPTPVSVGYAAVP